MAQEHSPLYQLLSEIDRAAEMAPLLAIAAAVALPDICVSLAAKDGRTNGPSYKAWCEANLDDSFSFLTPDDLYSMRCGVLHNGRFGDLKHNVARVIFVLPGVATFVNCTVNDAYFYSAVEFCRNLTKAARRWYAAHHEEDAVQQNLPRLMQYRFGGLTPYITGATVLA